MNEQEDHIPSFTALRFLKWFCPEHLLEEIEGDILQRYQRDLESPGPKSSDRSNPSDRSKRSDGYRLRRAKRRLLWNVIRFCRPGILLRSKFSTQMNNGYLLRNYVKMTFRMMMRNKSYAVINIAGLAIGLAASMLILL